MYNTLLIMGTSAPCDQCIHIYVLKQCTGKTDLILGAGSPQGSPLLSPDIPLRLSMNRQDSGTESSGLATRK